QPMVVALLALFVALAGTTWAGTGGKFILGQAHTADKTTSLPSTPHGAAPQTANTGVGDAVAATSSASNAFDGGATGAGQAAVYAHHNGPNAGPGVYATSEAGFGVEGFGSAAGGIFSGRSTGDGVQSQSEGDSRSAVYARHTGRLFGYGVYATASNGFGVVGYGTGAGGFFDGQGTGDGAQGRATADGKSGVWAHHDGGSYGYGLFAQSATGPAIGMKSNGNSAPMTLDGNPFPSATAGWNDAFIGLPGDKNFYPVGTLGGLTAGTYVVIATLEVGHVGGGYLDCQLSAGADSDDKSVSGDVDTVPMTLMVFHTFTGNGSAAVRCWTSDDDNGVDRVKISAIQVSGGSNNHF